MASTHEVEPWVPVGRVDELRGRGPFAVHAGREELVVVRVNGDAFAAFEGRCPTRAPLRVHDGPTRPPHPPAPARGAQRPGGRPRGRRRHPGAARALRPGAGTSAVPPVSDEPPRHGRSRAYFSTSGFTTLIGLPAA